MALQRSTSAQWRKVSLTPSMTPPSFSTFSSAMLEPLTESSMTSGMANRPRVTGTSLMPSQR